jgi:ABC-type cobalamin transport system ATPase subunit
MIESIGLRDFRGIRLGKVEGLTSLNVLIGPNNSGKTALLEAMYLGCAVGVRAAFGSRQVQQNPIVQLASSDLLGDHPMVTGLDQAPASSAACWAWSVDSSESADRSDQAVECQRSAGWRGEDLDPALTA